MSTDAISGKSEGREIITAALTGLLLILFSYILLKTINPDILKFSLFETSPSSSIPQYSGKQSTPEEVKQKVEERFEEQKKQDIRTIEQQIEDLKSIQPADFIEEGLIESQISELEKQLEFSTDTTAIDKKLEADFQRWIEEQPDEDKRAKEFEMWKKEFPSITTSDNQKLTAFFKWKGY